MTVRKGPVDRRLWLVTVGAIVAIVAVGILINRSSPSYTPSRLACASRPRRL